MDTDMTGYESFFFLSAEQVLFLSGVALARRNLFQNDQNATCSIPNESQ